MRGRGGSRQFGHHIQNGISAHYPRALYDLNYTRETNFDYIHSLSFFSVGLVIYDDNAPSAFKQDSQTWLHFRWNGGVAMTNMMSKRGEGV